MLNIILSKHTQKFLKSSNKDIIDRIIPKIEKLAADPFPNDSKRIIGETEKIYRIRVGDYRVTYTVFKENNEILIVDIDKRSRIYN